MKAKRDIDSAARRAVFTLDGGTCPSCAYTIEHLGRKVEGVRDIFVDVNESRLQVDYSPAAENEVLEAIPRIVGRIGYKAVKSS
jgi:copper chaperone CopZ